MSLFMLLRFLLFMRRVILYREGLCSLQITTSKKIVYIYIYIDIYSLGPAVRKASSKMSNKKT